VDAGLRAGPGGDGGVAVSTAPACSNDAADTGRAHAGGEQHLHSKVALLQQELNVFQTTIQGLKFAVEEADNEKQTLEAQNMELAERLAQLSQFVTYKAQSTKNATVDFGTWLSKHPKPQQNQQQEHQ